MTDGRGALRMGAVAAVLAAVTACGSQEPDPDLTSLIDEGWRYDMAAHAYYRIGDQSSDSTRVAAELPRLHPVEATWIEGQRSNPAPERVSFPGPDDY